MTLSAPSKWLAEELSQLLSATDLFNARFDVVFVRHARGLVGGREVDRDELMQTFLALQKSWNPSDCTYLSCDLHRRIEGFHVCLFFPAVIVHLLLCYPTLTPRT